MEPPYFTAVKENLLSEKQYQVDVICFVDIEGIVPTVHIVKAICNVLKYLRDDVKETPFKKWEVND